MATGKKIKVIRFRAYLKNYRDLLPGAAAEQYNQIMRCVHCGGGLTAHDPDKRSCLFLPNSKYKRVPNKW